MTATEIKCDGNVTSWEFYARDKGVFYASVWREEGIGHYVLVGKNLVNATNIGRQVRNKTLEINWWLVRGTLLMELGLLHYSFGNFSTRGERYYFGWRGACEVRICTRGENVYAR